MGKISTVEMFKKKPERSFDLKFKNISNFAIKITISTILS
jgi:hypothetical protein